MFKKILFNISQILSCLFTHTHIQTDEAVPLVSMNVALTSSWEKHACVFTPRVSRVKFETRFLIHFAYHCLVGNLHNALYHTEKTAQPSELWMNRVSLELSVICLNVGVNCVPCVCTFNRRAVNVPFSEPGRSPRVAVPWQSKPVRWRCSRFLALFEPPSLCSDPWTLCLFCRNSWPSATQITCAVDLRISAPLSEKVSASFLCNSFQICTFVNVVRNGVWVINVHGVILVLLLCVFLRACRGVSCSDAAVLKSLWILWRFYIPCYIYSVLFVEEKDSISCVIRTSVMFLGPVCAEMLKGSLTLAPQMYKTQTIWILKLKQVNVVDVHCLLLLLISKCIIVGCDFKVVHLIKICKTASGTSRTASHACAVGTSVAYLAVKCRG